MQINSHKFTHSTQDITISPDTLKPDTARIIITDTNSQIIDTLNSISDSTAVGTNTVLQNTTTISPGIGYYIGSEQILIQPKISNNSNNIHNKLTNSDAMSPQVGTGVFVCLSIILCYLINRIDNGINTHVISQLSYPITVTSLYLTGGEELSGASIKIRDANEVTHSIKIGEEPTQKVENRGKNLKNILVSSGIGAERFRLIGNNIIPHPITINEPISTNPIS